MKLPGAMREHPPGVVTSLEGTVTCLFYALDKTDGQHATVNRQRACYVNVHQAPLAVWEAWRQRGSYVSFDAAQHLQLFRGGMVRLGSYGDPCAVPYSVWSPVVRVASGRTGYTHAWQFGRFGDSGAC
jgi:hypothetical protein